MGAFMAGVAAYGTNVGAGSSYGAFIAALEHIAARLHGIGQQARHHALRRAVQSVHHHLRPRGAQDRRGRPDARRSAAAPAPPGELPRRRHDHAHAVGSAGALPADGRGAEEAARRSSRPSSRARTSWSWTARSSGVPPGDGGREGRLRAPQGREVGEEALPRHARPPGKRHRRAPSWPRCSRRSTRRAST